LIHNPSIHQQVNAKLYDRTKKILHVDDDLDTLKVIKTILEKEGYEVVNVQSVSVVPGYHRERDGAPSSGRS